MKISFYDPDEPQTTTNNQSSFTLDWVSELNWKKNPFSLQHQIAGMHEEEHEINLFFIKERRFGAIQGPTGSAKSTLLHWLSKELASRKGFIVHKIQAQFLSSAAQLRIEIADLFRGMFAKGREIETQELIGLIEKKTKNKHYVLLLDDVDEFEDEHADTLQAILSLENAQILVTAQQLPKQFVEADELQIDLRKRTAKEYEDILAQRIQAVGGEGMKPFSSSVVERMKEETQNIKEFLSLAQETAIHIALNVLTGDEESQEKLAQKAKQETTRKTTSSGVKGREKTKYDELIESLGEELTK